jgi:hypothetical protein
MGALSLRDQLPLALLLNSSSWPSGSLCALRCGLPEVVPEDYPARTEAGHL